ncbi:hypothetical protein JCM8097_006760 [Rhodosporidiobolus ruineniae]
MSLEYSSKITVNWKIEGVKELLKKGEKAQLHHDVLATDYSPVGSAQTLSYNFEIEDGQGYGWPSFIERAVLQDAVNADNTITLRFEIEPMKPIKPLSPLPAAENSALLYELFRQPAWADVAFLVQPLPSSQPCYLFASELVLRSRSSYFKNMFSSDFAEATPIRLDLSTLPTRFKDALEGDEAEFYVFEEDFASGALATLGALLLFLHGGKVNFLPSTSQHLKAHEEGEKKRYSAVTREHWQKHEQSTTQHPLACTPHALYRLADRYLLETLREVVKLELVDKLTVETVAYEMFSALSIDYEDVQKGILPFLLENWKEVKETRAWKQAMDLLEAGQLPGEPNLAGLPAKLKERIVACLDDTGLYDDDDWEDDSAAGDADKDEAVVQVEDGVVLTEDDLLADPADQRKASLAALSLVSREWYTLVAPVLWRDLWTYPCSTEALLELVRDILPRQGQYVDQILFRESPFDALLEDAPTDELPSAEGRALEVVEAAERLSGVDASSASSWELRILRARQLLLTQAVKACPKVTSLDIEGPLRPLKIKVTEGKEENEDDETAVVVPASEVPHAALEAVKKLGNAIEALSLLLPPDQVSTEQDAAELLASFPNLLRLEINSYVLHSDDDESTKEKSKADRAALLAAFSSLKKLEELDLGESSFVNDAFVAATADVQWPLKHLALSEHDDLSFASFVALVERFGSTLESLEIDGSPVDNETDPTAATFLSAGKALNLPKLVALDVATPHPASFLALFANSPLKEVFLGECPQLTVKDVIAFLEAHKDTLEDVDMEDGGIADEEEKDGEAVSAAEVVAKWCDEHGKNFGLLPSTALEGFDSDSDEEDEEEQ